MAPLNMSGAQLAAAIGVAPNRITHLVRKRRGVSADTAIRLGRYFGMSAEFSLAAQPSFDLTSALATHDYGSIAPRTAA